MKNFITIITISLLTSILVNCGGGGGGGDIYTTEYNNQSGLAIIGAKAINDAGYTGSGVNVAVVDSGIDQWHPEFRDADNNYVNLGTAVNYSNSSTNGWYDGNGHGTHVASTIAGEKDGSGIRGVAYNSTLYSYKIFNDSGSSSLTDAGTYSWSAMVARHETDSIKVSNNSWTSNTSKDTNDYTLAQLESLIPNTIDTYQSAVAAGTIFVWAAGNSGWTETSVDAGLPYRVSDIENGWLAVVAVDHNKEETDYTNRCGLAADWCVAAPGGDDDQDGDGVYENGIYAAKTNTSGYTRKSGTSMAAPHVTGIIATAIERFPSLTSAQIRTRILTNATYSGLTDFQGNASSSLTTAQKEAIWGQGLVTSDSTLAQVGDFIYPKTLNYNDDENININKNKISLPSGLSNNIYTQLAKEDFVVFDSFDGAHFTIKGKDLFKKNSTSQFINKIGYSNESIQEDIKPTDTKLLNFNIAKSKKPLNILSFKEGSNLSLPTSSMWEKKNSFLPKSKLFNDAITTQMEVSVLENKYKTNITSFIQSNNYQHSNKLINGYGFNMENNISKKLSLITSIGKIDSVNANFGIINNMQNNEVSTKNIDYGIKYQANKYIQGFYRNASIKIDDIESTNLSFGLKNAILESEVLGLEYKINDKKKFSFGLFKPSHFNTGKITLVTPSGRETDGTIKWENKEISANETVNNLFFSTNIFPIAKNTDLILNLQQSADGSFNLGYGDLKFIYHF